MGDEMSSFEILIDIPSVLLNVKKLQGVAAHLEDVNKILNNQVKKIDSSWRGNSADAMRDKLYQAQTTNRMLIDELYQVAGKLMTVSENIYNEDIASIQRIQNMKK